MYHKTTVKNTALYSRRAILALLPFVGLWLGADGARADDAKSAFGKGDICQVNTYTLTTRLVRPSKGSSPTRQLVVVTPPAYYEAANANKKFPVVYLLHGSPGSPGNFLKLGNFPERLQSAINAKQVAPVLFVIPDGNYVGQKEGDSEWADSADRRDKFETWLAREVVPWTDSHFRTRTDPSGRLIAGVSEGGFGAVNIALHNPAVFGGAIGLSGYYDMRGFGWGHVIMNDSEAAMSLNSPLFYVPEKTGAGHVPAEWKTQKFYLGAGRAEKPYADHTRRMGAALQAAGVRSVTVNTPNGKHDWSLWGDLFFDGLHMLLPAS